MLPRLDPEAAEALRTALIRAGYTTDGVRDLLGPQAHAALSRGEPEPAARATRDAGELGVLVRLLLLGATEPDAAVAAALAPLAPTDAAAAGLLRRDGDGWAAALDLRPHGDEAGDWWVLSDLTVDHQERDHVTGVGAASLTLAAMTVRRPVGTLLDLGTGCGVQALHATRHAAAVTATDVAPRALAMAAANFLLNDVDVELLEGSWFEPVEDRRFDQIVSNPPFVPGPPRVDYLYRDSGRSGDDALADLIRQVPEHLTVGGVAQVLGAWLHRRGEDWTERVSSWLPPGVDAWVVQRDVSDPALHVGTWQRDAGLDPASPQGRAQAAQWLDWMEAEQVEAVGFGLVTLRRLASTDEPGTVVFEDIRGAFGDPLGPEVASWLDRVSWLSAHASDEALLNARLLLGDDVVLERTARPGEEGWTDVAAAVVRTTGPRWRHDVDEVAAALLAGCQGSLRLRDLIELLAVAHDRPVDALVAATLPAVRELVRHGVLLPAEEVQR